MKKIILLIFLFLFTFTSCNNPKTIEEKETVKIEYSTDGTVNGFRDNPIGMPETIPIEEISVGQITTESNVKYCGNKNTKKFHRPSCSYAKKTAESNKIYYKNKEIFLNNGYTPCKKCNP